MKAIAKGVVNINELTISRVGSTIKNLRIFPLKAVE
jgi:hypothetical protein